PVATGDPDDRAAPQPGHEHGHDRVHRDEPAQQRVGGPRLAGARQDRGRAPDVDEADLDLRAGEDPGVAPRERRAASVDDEHPGRARTHGVTPVRTAVATANTQAPAASGTSARQCRSPPRRAASWWSRVTPMIHAHVTTATNAAKPAIAASTNAAAKMTRRVSSQRTRWCSEPSAIASAPACPAIMRQGAARASTAIVG